MNCLDQILCGDRTIIGIKDYVKCNIPESGLFINELPGMSLKRAANIAPEQWQSGAEFLHASIKMAIRQVFDQFENELSAYFDFTNIVETRKLKLFSEVNIIDPAPLDRGLIIKRWRSEAGRLFVNEIYINVVSGGQTKIKIIDGSEIKEYDVILNSGFNTVFINYKAESEHIKILFDQTNFETYNCTYNNGYTGYDGCNSCGRKSDKNIYVAGWDGAKEDTTKCFGIGLDVNVQCFSEYVLCGLLPKMSFLIWYKSGICVLKEHLASDRINHITIFGKDKAKEMLIEYEAEYKEKYSILVKSAYNYLKSTKGECITCNGTRYVQTLP